MTNCEVHKWKQVGACIEECEVCGTKKWAHQYEITDHSNTDNYGDYYGYFYKCTKCGHQAAKNSYLAEDGEEIPPQEGIFYLPKYGK
jgi:hypothetical protein